MADIAKEIWDWASGPTRVHTEAEWDAAIGYLVAELAAHLGREVRVDESWVDDVPGDASCSICSRVTVPLSRELDLVLHGSLCMSANRGGRPGISAELMAFCRGERLGLHRRNEGRYYLDLFVLNYEPDGSGRGRWTGPTFTRDETGEWEGRQQGPSLRSGSGTA